MVQHQVASITLTDGATAGTEVVTVGIALTIGVVVNSTVLQVTSSAGVSSGNVIKQSSYTAIVTAVPDSTHIYVNSTANFTATSASDISPATIQCQIGTSTVTQIRTAAEACRRHLLHFIQ